MKLYRIAEERKYYLSLREHSSHLIHLTHQFLMHSEKFL